MQIGDDHQYVNHVYWHGCFWLDNDYTCKYISTSPPPTTKQNFITNNVYYKT